MKEWKVLVGVRDQMIPDNLQEYALRIAEQSKVLEIMTLGFHKARNEHQMGRVRDANSHPP